MKTFVLVHGAWHASWYWQDVSSLLRHGGATVIAQDLPGHGPDDFDTSRMNLESYVSSVCRQINETPGKVHLVGHSMGGLIVSQVAERIPDKIEKLIYVAGFIPQSGGTLLDTLKSQMATGSSFEFSKDKKEISISSEAARKVFYHDCNEAVISNAILKLKPQGILPFVTPLQISENNFGSVEKVYIECSKDQAVFPKTQKLMWQRARCNTVVALDSGHFPMLSMANRLAELLMKA